MNSISASSNLKRGSAEWQKTLHTSFDLLKLSKYSTLRPVLPLLFNLKGQPYSISHHAPFEPMYRTRRPNKITFKTGRQVTKSTNVAADGVLMSCCQPNFTTLFVTPLHEQILRFSTNYVRPFIDDSPMRNLMIDSSCDTRVTQRSFINKSKLQFTFAFLSADRTRGISADKNAFDEIQDFDPEFIQIIQETMSHSPFKITQFTGTPKTKSNILEYLFMQGTQSEWAVKCYACGYWNIPSLDQDLEKMIGPDHPDIGPRRPGTVCAKCSKPVYPMEHGRWASAEPQRKLEHESYHIPQIILPLHYADRTAWKDLLNKRDGRAMTNEATFFNEVLGESYDKGTRLVTLTDLKKAAVLNPRTIKAALAQRSKYLDCILGVDWGGGGEKGDSYTAYAVVGRLPSGELECFYGHRSSTPHDHFREAHITRKLFHEFDCSFVAHDYNGAGTMRETVAVHVDLPVERTIPMVYQANSSSGIIKHHPRGKMRPRGYWTVDKSRSLLLTCACIQKGFLRFFKYDHVNRDNPGLLWDFLALAEDKASSRAGADLYRITSSGEGPCDFADAVNFACMAHWHHSGQWPDFAEDIDYAKVDSALLKELEDTDALLASMEEDDRLC